MTLRWRATRRKGRSLDVGRYRPATATIPDARYGEVRSASASRSAAKASLARPKLDCMVLT